jgi:hypothetical protein
MLKLNVELIKGRNTHLEGSFANEKITIYYAKSKHKISKQK